MNNMISFNIILDNIKTLIYIEDKSIFEKIDFDDDTIYLEPLLFAYFNSKKDKLFPKEILQEILPTLVRDCIAYTHSS